jgi:hypothetical protein
MEKQRLLKLLKSETSDIEAIGMILSNYTNYGHSELGEALNSNMHEDSGE